MVPTSRRCVLLFARTAQAEAIAKGLRGVEPLFVRSARRVRAAVSGLTGVDLVVVGSAPGISATATLRQRGSTLPARLTSAFDNVFALGYSEVVAVGLDSPGLASAHIEAAWRMLDKAPAVLGPSPDGGVYLVGLTRRDAPIVRAIPWGTRHVARALRRALPGAAFLGRLQDLDRPGDLRSAARASPEDSLLRTLAGRLVSSAGAREVVRPESAQPGRLPDSRAPPTA